MKDTKRISKAAEKEKRKFVNIGASSTKKQKDKWKRLLVKEYRNQPPETEKKMLAPLLRLSFIHQYLVCGYIADFAHRGKKIIVEFDGYSHKDRKEYDARRDQVLRDNGWRVLRYSNALVNDSPIFVINRIKEALHSEVLLITVAATQKI